MKTIQRKSLLYKTKVEYGDFTINHIQGCSHNCNYPCYAKMLAKRFGRIKDAEEWTEPKLVSNSLELLDKEIPRYRDKINSVHLCFMSDPFMYGYPEVEKMSLAIINKLNSFGIKCTILTKGILPLDLIDTSKENEFVITLISLDENYRCIAEPGASPYLSRINRLKELHLAGCKTWVSIEPYPTPNIINQNFTEVLESINFVDKIVFGRLNYNSLVTQYQGYQNFYNNLCDEFIEFCKKNNISYHIKEGTYKKND